MSKIIPYSTLARQHHLNFLDHQRRGYREREDHLAQLRKLLFQAEAQLRHAELQQLDTFRELADHFKIPLEFPNLGDRVGLQRFFAENPLISVFKTFLGGDLSAEECYQKILTMTGKSPAQPE